MDFVKDKYHRKLIWHKDAFCSLCHIQGNLNRIVLKFFDSVSEKISEKLFSIFRIFFYCTDILIIVNGFFLIHYKNRIIMSLGQNISPIILRYFSDEVLFEVRVVSFHEVKDFFVKIYYIKTRFAHSVTSREIWTELFWSFCPVFGELSEN